MAINERKSNKHIIMQRSPAKIVADAIVIHAIEIMCIANKYPMGTIEEWNVLIEKKSDPFVTTNHRIAKRM